MSAEELPPTPRLVLMLYFRGQAQYFAPDSVRVQVSGIVNGLASEPYPRGRGETRLRSTSSSLLVCGCSSLGCRVRVDLIGRDYE